MAKVRIGIATAFELENELVGIGTDNPTNTLQALGNIHSSDAKAIGISTFKTYQGFVDPKATISGFEVAKSGSISDEIVIEGTVTVSSGATVTSGPEDLTLTKNFTLPGISDEKPIAGTTRFNEDTASLEFYTGYEWTRVNSLADMGNNSGRAVWAGNQDPSGTYAHIQFTNFATGGKTQYFGELTAATRSGSGTAGTTRGLVMGGGTPSVVNTIQYITVPAEGDAIDFGDLSAARAGGGTLASSTRAIAVAGYESTPGLVYQNEIDYVEIMTKGNAADFGDTEIDAITSCVQSPTRGVFSQSNPSPSSNNTIAYITIASKGNATDFGLLSQGRAPKEGSASNSIRGIFGPDGTTVDYVTIATQGNAQAFTELTTSLAAGAACASQTRFMISGKEGPAAGKTIFMIQFATLGQATSFGDLSMAGYNSQALSNCHGGLGGF